MPGPGRAAAFRWKHHGFLAIPASRQSATDRPASWRDRGGGSRSRAFHGVWHRGQFGRPVRGRSPCMRRSSCAISIACRRRRPRSPRISPTPFSIPSTPPCGKWASATPACRSACERLAEAFLGRATAYDLALRGTAAQLAAALARNVYDNRGNPERLARYVAAANERLANASAGGLHGGPGSVSAAFRRSLELVPKEAPQSFG